MELSAWYKIKLAKSQKRPVIQWKTATVLIQCDDDTNKIKPKCLNEYLATAPVTASFQRTKAYGDTE